MTWPIAAVLVVAIVAACALLLARWGHASRAPALLSEAAAARLESAMQVLARTADEQDKSLKRKLDDLERRLQHVDNRVPRS